MPSITRSLTSAARLLLPSVLVAAVVVAPHASAGTPTPDQDPFYRYTGSVPLAQIHPGTVLKKRSIHASFGTHRTPINAEQLLYRTTSQLGEPTVTVTTVFLPKHAKGTMRLVGYLSFYDGLGPKCDPSYTMNAGHADSATVQESEEEDLTIYWYLAQGFAVTVPDFEGEQLHWMAGRESGYGSLDGIRATESYLRVGPRTPVGLTGYSGGALAGEWAAELAPGYAPELNIAGVASGGIPVDPWHMFDYINGTKTYSAAMPGMLLGYTRAYHVDLTPYLSAYGAKIVASMQDACMTAVFGKFGKLTLQQLMKPQYADLRKVPVFVQIINQQIMGTVPGHPRSPFLFGNGNKDGKGDGVMSFRDVQTLARQYCHAGVPIELHQYRGAGHQAAGAPFTPETAPFLLARLAGLPPVNDCRLIRHGDSIAPEPTPT